MAVAGGSQSVEYATMVECFEALVLGISQDPLAVANKLFSVRLASQNLVDRMLLQPRENRDKATEIVSLVMKKVEGSPDTLEVFMSILADLPSLDYLVGSLHEKYECNKNEVVEMLPTGNEQVTSFSVDIEEHVRLQREKEELEKERSQLIQEIQSQNYQLSKSTELLLSAQKKKEEFFNKNVELEAENKNIRQTAVATKEKLSTEIKMKEEDIKLKEEYIKLKEKEIKSLKKSLREHEKRLSLIDDRLQQVHIIDTVPFLQSSTSNLKSHSAETVHIQRDNDVIVCCCFFCYFSLFMIFLSFYPIGTHLLATLPDPTTGIVLVGNTDVVLVSRFRSSLSKVTVNLTEDFIPVCFYHGPCSEAGPFPQLLNYSTHLSVAENSHHRMDEPYLTAGSQKNYTLVISDSTISDLDPDPCTAKVHVFTDHDSYNQFIASGHVTVLSVSECFSPVQPLTLSLPPTTTDKQDMYYFVGVESRYSSTLNITVASDTLEYSTTKLSETMCNFSTEAPTCTIPIHHENDEELCLLASLIDTDSFTSVGYSAPPQGYTPRLIGGIILLTLASIFSSICLMSCICTICID